MPSVAQMVAISVCPPVVERPRQLQLLGIGQLLRPPPESSTGACRGQPGMGPLPDQIALELGQGAEDVEDELAARAWWCRSARSGS